MKKKMMKKITMRTGVLCLALFAVACGRRTEPVDDAKKHDFIDSLATLRNKGKTLRNEGNFDEALLLHNKGLTLAKQVNDTSEWVQALNNIGTDYRRMGLLDIAQEYHYEAWRMCEESSDTSRTMRKNKVVSLNGLGNIYLAVKDYNRADSAFRKALKGERELGSATGLAINYANIGSIYSARGNDKEARRYYEMSMMMNERDSNTLGMSLCHTYFGNLHEKAGEYDKARQEYMAAYELSRNSKDRWHALEPILSLVQLGLDTRSLSEAEAWLGVADKEVRDLASREHESEVCRLHYKVESRKGNYRDALTWHERAVALEDSIMNQDKNNRIHNIGISIERRRQGAILQRAKSELQEEKNRSLFRLWGVVIIAIVSSVIVGLLLYIQRLKNASMRVMQEASRVREDFFTNVTHEFRTPLTVILGLSREMIDRTGDGEWRSKCEAIYRQGNSLLRLVTQLLDMAKIKSRVGEPDWRHGNIVGHVRMIVETFSDYAAGKGIALTVESPVETLETDFVPDYINKVVGNLLSNSLKFTPPDGRITVRVDSDGSRLSLSVTDTGKGMTDEEKQNVFKPFFSAATANNGTGVGMALVKQIVDTLQGRIEVESEVGRGTTFSLVIPMRKSAKGVRLLQPDGYDMEQARKEFITAAGMTPETGGGDEARQMERYDESTEDLQRRVVLVVEDNRDVADYIGSWLSADYAVVYAANGSEGLRMAEDLMPDVIVSDLMMPGMDGLEMCRRIRSNDVVNHIPIIMLTARITEDDRMQGLEAGVDVYMSKPFNADELRLRIVKLLEQRYMLRRKYILAATDGRDASETQTEENDSLSLTADFSNSPYWEDKVSLLTDDFISKVTDRIYDMLNRYEVVSVTSLAEELGMNPRQLHRKLTAVAETTPNAFIINVKVRKAMKMIEADRSVPLKNVALACGFSDYSHFAKTFKSVVGVSASKYGGE